VVFCATLAPPGFELPLAAQPARMSARPSAPMGREYTVI
jgi:hypothetical protein